MDRGRIQPVSQCLTEYLRKLSSWADKPSCRQATSTRVPAKANAGVVCAVGHCKVLRFNPKSCGKDGEGATHIGWVVYLPCCFQKTRFGIVAHHLRNPVRNPLYPGERQGGCTSHQTLCIFPMTALWVVPLQTGGNLFHTNDQHLRPRRLQPLGRRRPASRGCDPSMVTPVILTPAALRHSSPSFTAIWA